MVVFYLQGLSIVSTVSNYHFNKQTLSSSDNRKVSQSFISRGLWGLIVCWWTAQVAQRKPAERDSPDRAGSHDQDRRFVSAPRSPPTTINTMKAPHMPVRNLWRSLRVRGAMASAGGGRWSSNNKDIIMLIHITWHPIIYQFILFFVMSFCIHKVSLSSQLSSFGGLRRALSENQLTGTLPTELGNMTAMVQL
jgi:hypothetical protein